MRFSLVTFAVALAVIVTQHRLNNDNCFGPPAASPDNVTELAAPYDAQVFKILERLPQSRVGTVDKFQGQEASVVIYSMTTSNSVDTPHGLEFIYSLNRLNVATTRARCVCVLVGSPELFTPQYQTPRQMQLANTFCRYRELATDNLLPIGVNRIPSH